MATATTKKVPVPALYKLLTYRRPHNSEGEKEYIKDFIMPLRPEIISDVNVPMAFMLDVGKHGGIMFTSHVDTVHGPGKETRQRVELKDGLYCKEDNQPLGADDASGNWLMFNMIHAGVPGRYVFFRGEERGGIGSKYCAKNIHWLFDNIKCAIAFDRRGTKSIITHQGGRRGCSEEFSKSLAAILGMGHESDDTGLYTDTKEFFGIIDNCTNLSVGYQHEHSRMETQDKAYIELLRDRLIAADWSKLAFVPIKADPPPANDDYNPAARFSKPMFERQPLAKLTAGEYADYLFDNSECLPTDLRNDALMLAQRIFKRIEG